MNILPSAGITFKQLERIFFEIGCDVARTLMEQYLLKADEILEKTRDKASLRHKGSRTTSIKTLMGEVQMKRTLYRRVNEAGATEHIFLLDKALGLDTIGTISPNLVEKILDYSCEMSYREVSEAVTGLTNQSISHQGVWNVVQAVGERQAEEEKRLVRAYENDELCGEREVPVLFEEADIVIGKYLASLTVFLVMYALTFVYPIIIIALGGKMEIPMLVGGYLAFLLIGMSFIAVGVFASSLTENQIVAAIIGFVILLVINLIDPIASYVGGFLAEVLGIFSLLSRYNDLNSGILDITSIIYYLSFTAVFLFLTTRVIDKRRWSQG
jgi:branched-subunit amino acid transport protein